MIVGIEGSAGAGKTTMAQTVAAEIGAVVIEGGAWYRALTFIARRDGVDLEDTEQLKIVASGLVLDLRAGTDKRTHIYMADEDMTNDFYDTETALHVPTVAKQLEVREIIEPLIIKTVRAQNTAIIVGRHIKKALPEAVVLRLKITDVEADRRHTERSGSATESVADRNAKDAAIATMLGVTNEGVVEIDVTNMDRTQQAEVLRQFIRQSFPDAY